MNEPRITVAVVVKPPTAPNPTQSELQVDVTLATWATILLSKDVIEDAGPNAAEKLTAHLMASINGAMPQLMEELTFHTPVAIEVNLHNMLTAYMANRDDILKGQADGQQG